MDLVLVSTDAQLCSQWQAAYASQTGAQRAAVGVSILHGDIFRAAQKHASSWPLDEHCCHHKAWADAIVSPSNSFGFLDGGIDQVYTTFFGGRRLQDRLQDDIVALHDGELPVGCATVVPTGDARIPWLVAAPTMRTPQLVDDTANAYLALRAALFAWYRHCRQSGQPKSPCPSFVQTGLVAAPSVNGSSVAHPDPWSHLQQPQPPAQGTQTVMASHRQRRSRLLCPGLGTGVGGLDLGLCARQMRTACDTFALAVSEGPRSTLPASIGVAIDNHLVLVRRSPGDGREWAGAALLSAR